MTELLTAAQMRAIEQAAIDSGEVTGLELMERAGRGVVEAVFEEWPDLAATSHRAVVLCGPGNNGGDGFVAARLLMEWGWEVEVFLHGDAGELPPDARVNCERWVELGEVAELEELGARTWNCDLLVDALFGTGMTRSLRGLGELFREMEDMVDCFAIEPGHPSGRPAIVAVDIPSGVCSDSGREFPHPDDHTRFSATAHLTVTFHRAKLGHYLAEGPLRCRRIAVKDIGLEEAHKQWLSDEWKRAKGRSIAKLSGEAHPLRLRKKGANHKYSNGHSLVLSGGAGRTGAARLAARGALRVGAGLVTLGVPGSAQMEVAAQVTAVMLRRVDDAAGLAEVLEDGRINALCLGPGLGVARAAELVAVALGAGGPPPPSPPHEGEGGRETAGRGHRAVVLDADALTAVAGDPALFGALHGRCVLTPHGGEFARLFPDIAEKLAETPTRGPACSKVDATREAAARSGAVVLFKGADTVIAAPDGRCVINSAHYERSAPWLATAGAGDVLAGFIAGLLARGMLPMTAAETAAWLHVECARSFGAGLIAEDLPEELPAVLWALGV